MGFFIVMCFIIFPIVVEYVFFILGLFVESIRKKWNRIEEFEEVVLVQIQYFLKRKKEKKKRKPFHQDWAF